MDKPHGSADLAAAKPVDRYHPVLVVLHWLLAVLLIAALAQGTFLLKQVPNASPEKLALLRVHMLVGISILVLMLVRLAVTTFTRHPPAAFPRSVVLSRLSRAVHGLLYFLVLSIAATGIGIAIATELPNVVFGGMGSLPATFDGLPQRALHGLLAKVLMVSIAAHILAAIHHQFIRKDGLMQRMILKSAPGFVRSTRLSKEGER